MRRGLLSVALIGLLAVLLVPAITIGSTPTAETEASRPATVAVQGITVAAKGLRDEAAMVLIGTVLIGVGAAVRRAA